MSYTFLQEREEESSVDSFSDIPPSVLSRLNLTADKCYSNDKETTYSPGSLYGMTSALLTEPLGEDLLTSCVEDSLVNRSHRRAMGPQWRRTIGLKCSELLGKLDHSRYSPRTWMKSRFSLLKRIYPRLDIKPSDVNYQRKTWGLTILGTGGGFLHTPTTMANYSAPSMQKHECCRNFVIVFGKPTPTNQEWMMGWPTGWTDLKPLEMDKYQLWLLQHTGS